MGRGFVVAVVALLALGLAGCTNAPESPPPAASPVAQADEAAKQVEVAATDTTGIIRGVVVDEAIRPLAGVEVAVEGTGRNQTTSAAGAFGFEGLAGGTYFLTAHRPRFEAVRIGIIVEAGKKDPEPVRVVMAAIPGTEPFIEAFNAKIFIALSVPMVGTLGGDDLGTGDPDRLIFNVQPNATVIQMETKWEATLPTSQQLRMYGSASEQGSPIAIHSASGASPLVIRVNGTEEGDVADGFYFGVGSLSRGITSTEPPNPNGYLVFNQQVDGFAHAFHNFMPDEGWVFVRDGPHALPPP